MQRFGATPEAWDQFIGLGLTDKLLPVVSNPNAKISANSKMQALGKTPSLYNRQGYAVGIPQWTSHETTVSMIELWKEQPDYGIAVRTGEIGGFDIDVEDMAKAKAIVMAIEDTLGYTLPIRMRGDSGKRLLAFRTAPKPKRVIPVDGGIIEVLGDGQQFIAMGMHPAGTRYRWSTGEHGPRHIPTLTDEEFERVWTMLVTMFATGEPRLARERRERNHEAGPSTDPVAAWLETNWETYDVGQDGQVFIECPFAAEHTSDTGATSTAYFPAGTGGFDRGHFVCLHAHCQGRDDNSFLDATGYNLAQFDDLTAEDAPSDVGLPPPVEDPEPDRLGDYTPGDPDDVRTFQGIGIQWPPVKRKPQGIIEGTLHNLILMMQDGWMVGRWIAHDAFTDNLVWAHRDEPLETAKWRVMDDAGATRVRLEIERRGIEKYPSEFFRQAMHAAAKANQIDTAMTWINGLEWDGVDRAERFCVDCWGWDDTPYARAVGMYVWTALAGRALEPGCQADMAPILVGEQGIRKTSAIKAMVPSPEMYGEIRLDMRDDDQSRALRGKLVGEIEELRGLNSRAIEEIKAFVSRRRESWVPKYKEFENQFQRRNLLIGSTNEFEFLADPTGERRWLPGVSKFIDIDYIKTNRDQLWAEGAAIFRLDGVAWQDAERLAKAEHTKYKIGDAWEAAIRRWLAEAGVDGFTPMDKGFVSTEEVMTGALSIQTQHQNRGHAMRVQKALGHMGYKRDSDGTWVR